MRPRRKNCFKPKVSEIYTPLIIPSYFMSVTEVNSLAKTIWDYHHLNHQLEKADCVLVLGSHDTRVAEYGVDLFLKGYAPLLIFSGGLGRLTRGVFEKPEAEIFGDIARRRGVPEECILVENQSTNTGENIRFTRTLLHDRNLSPSSFLLVQKPYMERRAYATFKKILPEKKCIVTSPPISFEEYPTAVISKDDMINIMVGDLQRIKVYAKNGFQIYQEIPKSVWSAYERLVELGFVGHLIKDDSFKIRAFTSFS